MNLKFVFLFLLTANLSACAPLYLKEGKIPPDVDKDQMAKILTAEGEYEGEVSTIHCTPESGSVDCRPSVKPEPIHMSFSIDRSQANAGKVLLTTDYDFLGLNCQSNIGNVTEVDFFMDGTGRAFVQYNSNACHAAAQELNVYFGTGDDGKFYLRPEIDLSQAYAHLHHSGVHYIDWKRTAYLRKKN